MNKQPLTIRDICFRWNSTAKFLFSGINCDFAPGSVSALMGANGTGKTTLLEVICKRLATERGKIEISDRPAQYDDFNYLPQDCSRLLFSHLTLTENIALQRASSKNEVPPNVAALFKDNGVLSRYPAQCSGGQRQRAAVCRAVLDMPHFPATLLDESFSSLSRDAKALLGPELKRAANGSGAIVIFVSHDVFDAMRFGDRVLTLTGGRLSSFDTSDVITENDCWQQTSRREEILHNLRASDTLLT
jgi:ABC-type sulfate/molybdate transport systems ATPase subunit